MGNPTSAGFQHRDSDPSQPAAIYVAVVSQSSTDAPTSTVLCNTLGVVPAWAYTSAGVYTLTANGKFTANTIVTATIGGTALICKVVRTSDNVLTFSTFDAATPSAANLAGTMYLKIEVYPS